MLSVRLGAPTTLALLYLLSLLLPYFASIDITIIDKELFIKRETSINCFKRMVSIEVHVDKKANTYEKDHNKQ